MTKIYYHQENNRNNKLVLGYTRLLPFSLSFVLKKGEHLKRQLPKSFMVVIRPLSTRLIKPSLGIDFKMVSFLLKFCERHFPLFKNCFDIERPRPRPTYYESVYAFMTPRSQPLTRFYASRIYEFKMSTNCPNNRKLLGSTTGELYMGTARGVLWVPVTHSPSNG